MISKVARVLRKPDIAEQEVLRDLFFEQDTKVLAASYRHGILRSFGIVGRSLFFRRRSDITLDDFVQNHRSIAVTFFQNERAAIERARERVDVAQALVLDPHNLAVIRRQLGGGRVLLEAVRFIRLALNEKGVSYSGRLTYPLLGWLIYLAFLDALRKKSQVTVITTNMVHPLSVAVAWAAIAAGNPTDYFEHGTTSRIAFRDRGYRRLFVQFPHTRLMMLSFGVAPDRVIALSGPSVQRVTRLAGPLRTAGICVNDLDSLAAIETIYSVLKARGVRCVFRLHEADPRVAAIRRLALQDGAGFSSAKDSRIEQFLGTVDLVIAGNSNVVADALLAGTAVVYYWDGPDNLRDYYGLVDYFKVVSACSRLELDSVIARAVADSSLC